MDIIIRAHIKNEERLLGLKREILSWYDKQLFKIGNLYLVNDHSPLEVELKKLCNEYNISVLDAEWEADTKNGLYWSVKLNRDIHNKDQSVMCVVDDAVFGKGILQRLGAFLCFDEEKLSDWGTVGLFACYEDATRVHQYRKDVELWQIPTNILYALVCHIYSPRMQEIIINSWENIKAGTEPYPSKCDDLWVVDLCDKNNLKCYNTMLDYAQHTGTKNRTFGESDSFSEYVSKMFVGE